MNEQPSQNCAEIIYANNEQPQNFEEFIFANTHVRDYHAS